jgi:hypothetical protein
VGEVVSADYNQFEANAEMENLFHAKAEKKQRKRRKRCLNVLHDLLSLFAALREICCSVDDYRHGLYTSI